MRGAFDDEYIEQRKSSRDAEITLGAGTMLLISAGLVVVCGLCFGLGYIAGHREAAPAPAAQETANLSANPRSINSLPKPSATAQASESAPKLTALQTDTSPQTAANAPSQSAAISVPISPAQSAAPSNAQPQVRPALPATTPAPQHAPAFPSHPAYSPSQQQAQGPVRAEPVPLEVALWVQIAAVSHVEDAQVLTTALRKRGYTVTPRREADNLIHVRVGPFTTNDEANRWRVKLLGDGYNAEVQQ
jgi:DedD protein